MVLHGFNYFVYCVGSNTDNTVTILVVMRDVRFGVFGAVNMPKLFSFLVRCADTVYTEVSFSVREYCF